MSFDHSKIPAEAAGLKLHRLIGDRHIACEQVQFPDGRPAVITTLLRAEIAGRVEVDGEIEDHFVDVHDAEGDLIQTVALDAKSYRSLKTRWMRCRTERFP